MALRMKTFFLLLLLLLIPLSSSSGMVEGVLSHGMYQGHSLHKDGMEMKSRRLLMLDAMLDYDDAGANPKHDPRKKPGNGSGKP